MKPLFLVVECPVDDTLDKAVAHSLVSHEMHKKADSHSLDPRNVYMKIINHGKKLERSGKNKTEHATQSYAAQ